MKLGPRNLGNEGVEGGPLHERNYYEMSLLSSMQAVDEHSSIDKYFTISLKSGLINIIVYNSETALALSNLACFDT
jgi:hypothetical protein